MAQELTPMDGTRVYRKFNVTLKSIDFEPPTCNEVSYANASTVDWYRVNGTCPGLRAYTESSNTSLWVALSVYTGSCSNLACVGAAEGRGSTVAWVSEPGVNYYITIGWTGSNSDTSVEQFYSLGLEEFEVAVNDVCENAIQLTPDPETVTLGSTQYATSADISSCLEDDYSGNSTTGLWYVINGTGEPLQASTCTFATTFFSELQVFSGSCGDLQCVPYDYEFECRGFNSIYLENGLDEYVGFKGRAVRWNSTQGTLYYIHVMGKLYSDVSYYGEFGLLCNEIRPTVNDECVDAMEVSVDSGTVVGTTVNATSDGIGICSRLLFRVFPSIWFKVVGTGSWLRASTANNLTILCGVTHGIAAYSGSSSCWNFTCLGYQEGVGTEVAWLSNPGELYYIHFASWYPYTNVGLSVAEFEPAANDHCEGATELTIGATVIGSTENATYPFSFDRWIDETGYWQNPGCVPEGPGVWYRVVGTGRVMRASTCHNATDYDTTVNVLSGECGSLTCLQENREMHSCAKVVGCRNKILVWNSSADVTYYIHITFQCPYSYHLRSGRFGLTVEELQ